MSFLNDYKIYQKNSNKWSDNPAASEGSWMIAQEHIHIQNLNFLDCNSANREGETEKGTTQRLQTLTTLENPLSQTS